MKARNVTLMKLLSLICCFRKNQRNVHIRSIYSKSSYFIGAVQANCEQSYIYRMMNTRTEKMMLRFNDVMVTAEQNRNDNSHRIIHGSRFTSVTFIAYVTMYIFWFIFNAQIG